MSKMTWDERKELLDSMRQCLAGFDKLQALDKNCETTTMTIEVDVTFEAYLTIMDDYDGFHDTAYGRKVEFDPEVYIEPTYTGRKKLKEASPELAEAIAANNANVEHLERVLKGVSTGLHAQDCDWITEWIPIEAWDALREGNDDEVIRVILLEEDLFAVPPTVAEARQLDSELAALKAEQERLSARWAELAARIPNQKEKI